MIKINPWYISIGLLIALCLVLVWNASLRRSSEEQSTKISQLERDLTISQSEEKVKIKTATIITEKPDGTKITEVIKEEKSSKVSTDIADKEKVTQTETSSKKVTSDRQRYSVGVYRDFHGVYSGSAGFALGDLPMEAVLLGTDNLKSLSLGVQFRW